MKLRIRAAAEIDPASEVSDVADAGSASDLNMSITLLSRQFEDLIADIRDISETGDIEAADAQVLIGEAMAAISRIGGKASKLSRR